MEQENETMQFTFMRDHFYCLLIHSLGREELENQADQFKGYDVISARDKATLGQGKSCEKENKSWIDCIL